MQSSQLDLKNMVGQLFDEKEVVSVQEEAPKKIVVESEEGTKPVRKSFSLKKTKQEPKYQGKSALLEQQHNPLFGGGTLTEVPVIPESKQESFQDICDRIQESYPDNPNNKELIEKVSKRLSETTHNPFGSSTEQVSDTPKEYSENLMNTVGGFLSDTAKFDDEEIERSYFEERFDFVQKQLEGMKRSILENTVVSGIGHGMYGSSSGGGEVLLSRMDDVETGDGVIADGDSLIWSSTLNKWKPQSLFDGLVTLGSGDINLSTDYDYASEYAELGAIDESIELKTQDQINQLNIEVFKALSDQKPSLNISNATSRSVGSPVDPTDGDLWIDDGTLKYYDTVNEDWRTIRSSSPIVHTTESTPVEATSGDFWFNTSTGLMSVYYVDDDSTQWVSISGYNNQGTTTTIEELQAQITALQTRIGELENEVTISAEDS